jgi:hypothetical protein
MRRMAFGGIGLGLALCILLGSEARAERDTYQPPRPAKKSWWWPFGSSSSGSAKSDEAAKKKKEEEAKKQKEEDARKAAQAKEAAKKLKDPVEAPGPAPEFVSAATSMSKEQAKFIRRQQVCDRLREVALETGNIDLEKQAQLLEQRAWLVYEQKTQARLPSLSPLETTAAAKKLMADEPVARRRVDDRPVRSVSAKKGDPSEE